MHGRESYRFIFQEHSFGKEVNPNSGLMSKTDKHHKYIHADSVTSGIP